MNSTNGKLKTTIGNTVPLVLIRTGGRPFLDLAEERRVILLELVEPQFIEAALQAVWEAGS